MTPIASIVTRLRQYLVPLLSVLQVPGAPPLPPLPPSPPSPQLASLAPRQRVSAVEILKSEPNLSAAELAQRAGVTHSYASMLVRQRRPRPVAAPLAPVRPFGPPPPEPDHERSRTNILNAAAAGTGAVQIAEQFGIAPGEVEFVLKIGRLTKKI